MNLPWGTLFSPEQARSLEAAMAQVDLPEDLLRDEAERTVAAAAALHAFLREVGGLRAVHEEDLAAHLALLAELGALAGRGAAGLLRGALERAGPEHGLPVRSWEALLALGRAGAAGRRLLRHPRSMERLLLLLGDGVAAYRVLRLLLLIGSGIEEQVAGELEALLALDLPRERCALFRLARDRLAQIADMCERDWLLDELRRLRDELDAPERSDEDAFE